MKRPSKDEYNEYYELYVDQAAEGDIIELMAGQLEDTVALLGGVSEERADFRYGEGKWSIKELVGHLVDVERTFSFRGFFISKKEKASLPGMEQDDYIKHTDYSNRTLKDLIEEFVLLRKANVLMFKSFNEEVLSRRGIASGCEFTVRSFPYILVGHEIHHGKVLKEKYL